MSHTLSPQRCSIAKLECLQSLLGRYALCRLVRFTNNLVVEVNLVLTRLVLVDKNSFHNNEFCPEVSVVQAKGSYNNIAGDRANQG